MGIDVAQETTRTQALRLCLFTKVAFKIVPYASWHTGNAFPKICQISIRGQNAEQTIMNRFPVLIQINALYCYTMAKQRELEIKVVVNSRIQEYSIN